jgi:glycolate oxidase iron-sulfur subunit
MLKKSSAELGASQNFRDKVQDITQFLVQNKVKIKPKGAKAKKVLAAYHDPCHLNRGLGINEEPRQLLEDAGLKLIDLENADQCCGGGGTFRLFNQDLAMKIAQEKIDAVYESGAPLLAAACPGCIMQFNDAFEQKGRGLPVKHVVELLTL